MAGIKDHERRTVEANLHRAVNELNEKLQKTSMQYRKVEAALHGQITDVNRKHQDSNNDKKKVETTLRSEINYDWGGGGCKVAYSFIISILYLSLL
jgi:flagellar hook-basal body complex protein FliE